jgi:hypothetical protein
MHTYKALSLLVLFFMPGSLRAQVTPMQSRVSTSVEGLRLVSPASGESRDIDKPVTFRWASLRSVSGRESWYLLTIAPVFAGQTPEVAIAANRPLFSRIVSAPMFEYRSSAPPFEQYPMATGFAWQVQAVDSAGRPLVPGGGKSQTALFTLLHPPKLPPVKNPFPHTLIAGTFRIDVEAYDTRSLSLDTLRTSGIGRVRFTCPPVIHPFPWPGLHPTLRAFSVVETVTDSLTEIPLADALLIQPDTHVGERIELTLPERPSALQSIADKRLLFELIHGLTGPQGIRVRFHDVKWFGPPAATVVLTEGTATYPTLPAIPPVPALVGIDPGFTLAIDSLIITPARASVKGSVLLPQCLVSTSNCTKSSLPLPWTVITGLCELYREVPDSSFGPLHVGETGFQVQGHGYTLDFSSIRSDPAVAPSLANSWKGVVLKTGETPDPPADTIISNRGYAYAKYRFLNGLVTGSGLQTRLQLASPFAFQTLEPLGYLVTIQPPNGFVQLGSCGVQGGQFYAGMIQPPAVAVRDEAGHRLVATYDTLAVQNDMDLFGAVKVNGGFIWGEFFKTASQPKYYQLGADHITGQPARGYFYLAARQRLPYYPTAGGIFTRPDLDSADVNLELQGIQGITLTQLRFRTFTIWTQDVPAGPIFIPKKLEFRDSSIIVDWFNIIGTGIHTEIRVAKYIAQANEVKLGPTWSTNPRYQGEVPLRVSFKSDPQEKQRIMTMQFVESATWHSNFDGRIFLGGPMNDTTRFSDLTFTSTADAGGAHLDLTHTLPMDYWGVTLVPRDSASNAGVVCVKLGVIYTTAAGINEPRHFARPFWLTWGEIKASGNLGRLSFDYNAGGQCFDRIPYTPSFVRLSDYDTTSANDSGLVITYGNLAFSFFGAKPLWVHDWKSPHRLMSPFGGRTVRTPLTSPYGTGSSDLHLARDWGDGVANLDFTVQYDSLEQDGFAGPGSAAITKFVVFSRTLDGVINVKAERSCFSLSNDSDVNVNLGPLFTSSAMSKIWGCGCIVGDNLERVAVGGELSANAGAGFSLFARTGGAVSVVMGYSPSRTDMLFAGDAYVVLLTRNAEVIGYITLTIDRDADYAAGYAKGVMNMDGLVSGVSGTGEFQWHLGADEETIQGRVAVSMYSMGIAPSGSSSSGKEAGLWLGVNSNKDEVWVMDGISGRFGLNKSALPQYITGFYGYVSWSDAVNAFYVLSGGYQAFAGLGAFAGYGGDIGGGFGVIGNVGLYVWGKVLGGVVSADAWGDLQLILGIPPAFAGEIGVDVCVLFVICASETIHGGFNASQGFYIY